MKNLIVPSLIAKNQKELDERFEKVRILGNSFHLDVMDGRFVKNKSLMFSFKLPKKREYIAHLMMKDPMMWIHMNLSKLSMVILHAESENLDKAIEYVKKKGKKVGIAIKSGTALSRIEKYLDRVDFVLVMTVEPGSYGSKFLDKSLNKVKRIRKMKKKLNIGVDGGINDKTIRKASRAGAKYFVVGSYFQKAVNVRNAYKDLNREL